MTEPQSTRALAPRKINWLLILSSALILGAYFLPWVRWDQTLVSGSAMASADFFEISERQFGLANPFPATAPLMLVLWLIPVGALALLLYNLLGVSRGATVLAVLTSFLLLSLIAVYYLFSETLADLGARYGLEPGIYLALLTGIALVVFSVRSWVWRILFILAGPLISFGGFTMIAKHLEGEQYEATAGQSSAYTVNALDLIEEFKQDDSLANSRYREQIITVTGNISVIEFANDGSANIRFEDSTGSYAIFPFGVSESGELEKLKEGERISIKASCSGGVYSEILETQIITFKRATLIKQ